ncbi:hypothetical protein CAS74_004196 [Pichia kudriavzevii]|uniref:N-acetyltransferase domain-containing protein n=1 Tax=Pichia kudriavzevii TaxID=4909 RepID=A0A1Z8JIW7_PICKU|nr:hypothetical protein CAS74_004196 [Pichia kudriavzevii]
MPVTIRRARIGDLQGMQNANLHNLPENYTMKYYLYHLLSWPEASFVAVSTDDMEENVEQKGDIQYMADDDTDADADKTPHGHITSLSVMRSYRRTGLAEKLMRECLYAICESFGGEYVSLHVRESNRAALHLYRDTLEFTVLSVEKGYYQDGEDAYYMRKDLKLDELVPSKFQKGQVDDLQTPLV